MQIDPQIIEKALYRFLMDQQRADPTFIRRLMEDVEEDAALSELMEETEKTDNPSVPAETVLAKLRD